jgi:hypothetical protein
MRKVVAADSVAVPDTRIKTLPVKDSVAIPPSAAKPQPKPIPAATTNHGFIAPKSPKEPSAPKLPVVKEPAVQQVPVMKSSRPAVPEDSTVKTKSQQDGDVWQPDSVHAADSLKATAVPAAQTRPDSTQGFIPPNKSVAPVTKTPVLQKKVKKAESTPKPEDDNW